jgi:hypothetical protein
MLLAALIGKTAVTHEISEKKTANFASSKNGRCH